MTKMQHESQHVRTTAPVNFRQEAVRGSGTCECFLDVSSFHCSLPLRLTTTSTRRASYKPLPQALPKLVLMATRLPGTYNYSYFTFPHHNPAK